MSEQVVDGVTLDDIKEFCEIFKLAFYHLGTPDNKDDRTQFWVGVVPRHAGWSLVGTTVQMDKVRQWLRGELRALTYLRCDKVYANMPLPEGWTNEQVIDLDNFLRRNGIICEEQEIAVTDFLTPERREKIQA